MSFLSRLHTDLRRTRLTRRGATHRAEDVPCNTHKEYARMDRVELPEPDPLSTILLSDALASRSSTLRESGEVPLSIRELSTVLGLALGKKGHLSTRKYPSGGALYPIETYLIANDLKDARPGIYHYHPSAHALERLWDLPPNFLMKRLVSKPDFLSPSILMVFTSVWARSSAKYGDLAYQHALLEAGHMSQNVLLVATALGIENRPMAGFDDDYTIELLDIDETLEQPVHSITLSKSR